MPDVRLTIDKLPSRGTDVQKMLRPLSRIGSGPAWEPRSGSTEFVIGTHDGARPASRIREWRFSTPIPTIKGSYYETWLRYIDADAGEYWFLHKAYLQLYYFDRQRESETEFLMLHCDPNEPESSDHARYKKGPHLHAGKFVSRDPFPHAHIALNLGHLDAVLKDTESLFTAMDLAIHMIVDEILTLYVE
jgi:hypothetical protein